MLLGQERQRCTCCFQINLLPSSHWILVIRIYHRDNGGLQHSHGDEAALIQSMLRRNSVEFETGNLSILRVVGRHVMLKWNNFEFTH